MKEKLTRNISLKVLSVILASILWLVITNLDDPIRTEDFYNVPVEILNEDAIDELGQVYEIVEGKTVNFTAAARRSIADNLTVSDFRVTADFSKLSEVHAVTIDISSPRYGNDVTITSGLYQMMKVELEDLADRHFKVKVVQQGEPAEGYYVGNKSTNTILKVSGPKSKIERIEEIVVEVDVTDVTGPFRIYEEPKALDAEGNVIDASNLSFSENSIAINIAVYKTKKIDLEIKAAGTPANGYVMTKLEYEPKSIEIAGEDSSLKSISKLVIDESIEGASKNIEKEVDIQGELPDGVVLVGEDKTAVVNISIERAETKEVTIWPGDLEIRNKAQDLNLSFLTSGPITILVSGPKDAVAEVTRNSIKPYIDLTGYTSGTYAVEIKVQLTPYITMTNSQKVSVYLSPY